MLETTVPNVTYSEINTLARKPASLVMWLWLARLRSERKQSLARSRLDG